MWKWTFVINYHKKWQGKIKKNESCVFHWSTEETSFCPKYCVDYAEHKASGWPKQRRRKRRKEKILRELVLGKFRIGNSYFNGEWIFHRPKKGKNFVRVHSQVTFLKFVQVARKIRDQKLREHLYSRKNRNQLPGICWNNWKWNFAWRNSSHRLVAITFKP